VKQRRLELALLTALWLALPGCGLELFDRSPSAPAPNAGLVELPAAEALALTDDSDTTSLLQCVRQSLDELGRLPSDRVYKTAGETVRVGDLLRTLAAFESAVQTAPRPIQWPALLSGFRLLRAVPASGLLFTGYFQPELPASRERSERFHYPIYRVPDDLVQIDLKAQCPGCATAPMIGRIKEHGLVPYYSRAEIDAFGVLDGQEAELAWLDDPIDAFFLHVQGSGLLRFPDGTAMQVSFAGSNGRDYKSIGKMLVEAGKVPLESASLQSLRQYLREHPEERDSILFANERYIFFRPVPVGPIGSLGVPLTPGRSIAVDPGSYPLGSLAFIRTTRAGEAGAQVAVQRFVCAQDAGAAIAGPGRVDVFWGAGAEAERLAGPMRSPGEMVLLLAR
jgi:membrane-bound lytic murein transglycosylase A